MAWLSGYSYRQKIPIGNCSDGSKTNYQKVITINSGSGTSTAGNIYLQGHAKNFPNDIRFTKADGTTLIDFWRYSSDSSSGIWWVELPNIDGTNATDYYIYYGKTDDTDASNITNTFIFGDDFQYSWTDSDLNTGSHTDWDNKWLHQYTDGTSAIEDDGSRRVLSLYGNASSWQFEGWSAYDTISYPYIVEYDFAPQENHSGVGWTTLSTEYNPNSDGSLNASYQKYKGGERLSLITTNKTLYTTNVTLTKYQYYKFKAIFSNDDFHLYLDDVLKIDQTNTTPASTYKPNIIIVFRGSINVHFHIDNFRIRQYTANDPSWNNPSSEETAPVVANFFPFF